MIKIDSDEKKMEIKGGLAQVSAECIMIMRAIYRKNLELFPEPEIAVGILTNMVIKAMMPDKVKEEEITEEMIFDD
jgi:hypothetical protein